jgi:hypothetical protein
VIGAIDFAAPGWFGSVVAAAGLGSVAFVWRRAMIATTRARATMLTTLRAAAWIALILILIRPVWTRASVDWEKPLLVVLLDASASMGIADFDPTGATATRAARVARAVEAARTETQTLRERYDLRLIHLDQDPRPSDAWDLSPEAPTTDLTAGLQLARGLRSCAGRPARCVLMISDGADNVGGPRLVADAAAALVSQQTRLLAVGVGPRPGATPAVSIDPLMLPARIGLRERVHVRVSARTEACENAIVPVELDWDGAAAARSLARLTPEHTQIAEEMGLLPPGPGLHRLTARITLPPGLGGASFATSTLIEVDADRVRVLLLESTPRNESAFIARALLADPNMQLTQRFLAAGDEHSAAGGWSDLRFDEFDVVILGAIHGPLPDGPARALADAVLRDGVGLMLAGGSTSFGAGGRGNPLWEEVSPVGPESRAANTHPRRFSPTSEGLNHSILTGVWFPDAAENANTSHEAAAWSALPPLAESVILDQPRPLALVLARDDEGAPLLAVQTAGRGRCAAAAWESTWPWALASDEGAVFHRRLWRQIAMWLASREPAAWVITDEPAYPAALLAGGQRSVLVRAGTSGLRDAATDVARTAETTLTLRGPVGRAAREPIDVPLTRRGEEWVAELPASAALATLPVGEYELTFRISRATRSDTASSGGTASESAAAPGRGASRTELIARTAFHVADEQLELRPPTSNLDLLRNIAERAAIPGGALSDRSALDGAADGGSARGSSVQGGPAPGGSAQAGAYFDIEELPRVIGELAQKDERVPIERLERFDLVARRPWWIFGAFGCALAFEWALRKRLGLT